MLSSLLPGLRDVRTPLTTGYLWLLMVWLVAGADLPRTRPAGEGPIAQLFDLVQIVGPTAGLAALSFVAYLVGAVLQIPTERGVAAALLRMIGSGSMLGRPARVEELYISMHMRAASEADILYEEGRIRNQEWQTVTAPHRDDLRPLLLIKNQELYGEFDRLAAEASFRVNVAVPLAALSTYAGIHLGRGWSLAAMATSVLFVQGARRVYLADLVLLQAVRAGVIEPPLATQVREWRARPAFTVKSQGPEVTGAQDTPQRGGRGAARSSWRRPGKSRTDGQ